MIDEKERLSMKAIEILLERVEQLIEKGEAVRATRREPPPNVCGWARVNNELFEEWKTNSLRYIELYFGRESYYFENFLEIEGPDIRYTEKGLGILKAIKDDIRSGHLRGVKELVTAEIFTDFLDMAEHLFENGYKDPAASLIGAVLEDSLRKLCLNNSITLKAKEDISSLNHKLADKNVYNRLVQRQIQAWEKIRDYADHGKFDEYKLEDVNDMLKGVRRFLEENFG